MKTAWIAGATGLVGGELLKLLLDHPAYGKVVALVRRPLTLTHPKLHQAVVDFDRLAEHTDLPAPTELFCALGTTRKKTPSLDAYRKVDLEYPGAMARVGKARGAGHYGLVSSMGADAQSSAFYTRIKGEAEQAVAAVGIPSVQIFRPSLLLGDRQEYRLGERVATVVMKASHPLMGGPMRKYRAIHARTVAQAMVNGAQKPSAGTVIYLNDQIEDLGSVDRKGAAPV